jgi:hypothetical protein
VSPWAAHPDFGGIEQAGCPVALRWATTSGHIAQRDPVLDGTSPLGQQRADRPDGTGDRGAGRSEPAGQDIMDDSVAQVHQGGQQPVDEHQLVPGTGADRPLPRSIGQACVLARLPARQFDEQLSEGLRGQCGHSAIGNSGGTGQRP